VIRRSGRLLVEVAGILVAGLILLVAAGAWRLQSAPVEIGFLTPVLEEAMNRPAGPRLEIGTTRLRWEGFDSPLVLAATEVRIRDGEGGILARIPEMAVSLDVPSLVRGRLVPRRLVLVNPVLRVVRGEDGALRFELGTEAAADPAIAPSGGTDVFARLLDALRAPAGAAGEGGPPMAALEEIGVTDARLIVDDRALGRVWYAPEADVDLRRDGDALAGRFEGMIDHRGRRFEVVAEAEWRGDPGALSIDARVATDLAGRPATLTARTGWSPDADRIEIDLAAGEIVPAALAGVEPMLAPLGALVSPIRGRARVVLDDRFEPVSAAFDLTGASGRLDVQSLYEAPLTFAELRARGRADFREGWLDIDQLALDLGGPRVTATGRVETVDETLDVVASAELTDLPTDLLARYWPPNVGVNAREWITANLTRGGVEQAGISVHARAPRADPGALEPVALDGRIAFADVRLTVLDGLPPIQGLDGVALFDGATFTIEAGGGSLRDLAVPEGRIVIRGLDTGGPHTIDIDTVATGPLGTALEILDSPGLGFASELGLDPARTQGTASARLRFAFPLEDDLLFEQVALSAAANIRDGRIDGLSLGLPWEPADGEPAPVSAIDAGLTVDGQGLTMEGTAAYGDIPVSFAWSEPFVGDGGTRVDVSARLAAGERAALGLPAIDGLSGPVGVEAAYRAAGPGDRIDLVLDLSDIAYVRPEIGFLKPAGVPASATLSVEVPPEGPVEIAPFRLEAASGLAADGALRIARDTGALLSARLDRVSLGESRFTVDVQRRADTGFGVTVAGESLDLGPALGDRPPTVTAADPPPATGEAGSAGPPGSEGPGSEAAGWPPLEIEIGLERLILGPGRELRSVSAYAQRDAVAWRRADLSATTPPQGTLSAALRPTDEATGRLELRATDAGAAAQVLDMPPGIRGGMLEVDALRGADGSLEGRAVMTGFVVVDAPVLARLLAALSLGGLQSLLTGDGLEFSRAETRFAYTGETVSIEDFAASGGALGITADGTVDLGAERLDIAGTIVPIYGLSQVIGAIPLLGDVLTGGGDGVFAFTYSATGPLDDPRVGVNPISVLAPGFLRTLFFLDPEPPRDEDGNIIDLPPRPERRGREN